MCVFVRSVSFIDLPSPLRVSDRVVKRGKRCIKVYIKSVEFKQRLQFKLDACLYKRLSKKRRMTKNKKTEREKKE